MGASGPSIPAGATPLEGPDALIQWYRSAGDVRVAEQMASLLHELIPNLSPESVRSDACANCQTRSGLPFIGPLQGVHGCYIATGGNGQAAKSSDEIGRLATCAALSKNGWDESEEHELLAADRFVPVLK